MNCLYPAVVRFASGQKYSIDVSMSRIYPKYDEWATDVGVQLNDFVNAGLLTRTEQHDEIIYQPASDSIPRWKAMLAAMKV